ncbi:hypothetical protein B0H13DRAFT_2671912 [Mycena leptocephala]|nr:hypothetical protein B0H13DRAFT_2671912 [Mycena leptocephala]
MSLLLQPPELLDAIASLIRHPRDLLSVALASKALHDVVVPGHLEFREVCCDSSRTSLWTALAENPPLAGRILSLDLQSEPISTLYSGGEVVVPKSLATRSVDEGGSPHSSDKDGEAGNGEPQLPELCAAISKMHSLTRFRFDSRQYKNLSAAVFQTLRRHCPNMREFEVHFDYYGPNLNSITNPIWELSNLTRASITMEHPLNTMYPDNSNYLGNLFDMLGRCPQLQDLRIVRQIRGAERDLSGFLADLTWPRLTRLILGGIFSFTFSAPSTITAFLGRHPQLEMLLLFLPESVDLPVLPHLRYVSTPSFSKGSSTATAAQLPGLEYLHMITPFGIETDTNIIIRYFTTFPSLRGTTVSFLTVPALERFSRAVPQLERLEFQTSPWNSNFERGTQTNLPSPDCIALLTRFAHLKHLDSSAVINDEDADADATLDTFLRALAAAPQLACVGVDWKYHNCDFSCLRWFSILRDNQGAYAGHKEVRRLRGVKFHDWEDVFRVPGLEL